MAIKVRCECGKELVAKDEMAGKRVRCPACQAVLAIPSGAAPARTGPPPLNRPRPAPAPMPRPRAPEVDDEEDDEEEEEDRTPKSRKVQEKMKGLARANVGLLLHLIRFGLMLGAVSCWLLACLGALFLAVSVGGKAAGDIRLLYWIAAIVSSILLFPTTFLAIVGSIMCLWLPARANGKGPIIASLVCLLLGNVIPMVTSGVLAAIGVDLSTLDLGNLWATLRFALVMYVVGFLCLLATDACFFMFLRNMCRYTEEKDWEGKADSLIVMWGLMIIAPPALGLGIYYFLVNMLALDPGIIGIVMFAFIVGTLIAFTRILVLVLRIIIAIRKVISAHVQA